MLALSLAASLALAAGADSADRPVVSVVYFENNTKDSELELASKGLTDLFINDLAAWEGVRVVERSRLEEVMKELKFQQTKYVDKATASKLGKVLAASYLVYGSITLVNAKLKVAARLVRSSDGEVVISVAEEDDRDRIFDIEQRLANQLIAGIDAKLSANAQARRKVKVPDIATVIAYGKVLDLSDQGKLDEAQAAVRALVSKAPTFLLGRERQQELLKKFEEYQKRKKDLLNASVIELGKRVDAELKNEAQYDAMTFEQKQHFLQMRVLKGRFLARVLKQYLSKHGRYLKLALEPDEPKAVVVMRDWVENQRRLMSEVERGARKHASVFNGVTTLARMDDGKLTTEEAELLRDGVIGSPPSSSDMDFDNLAEFVLLGQVNDGERFRVGPCLGAVDPKLDASIRKELDDQIAALLARPATDTQREHLATSLLELKANIALAYIDIDGAVTAYQAILDNFPNGYRASWVEGKIKELLEGRGNEFHRDNEWTEALRDCDDKLNGGSLSIDRRLFRTGVRGIDQMAAEMEKACKITNKNKTWAAYAYKQMAETAAEQDDCKRTVIYWRKFAEIGGEPSTIESNSKAFHPWCDVSEVQQKLTWFRVDGDVQGDFPRWAHAIKSYDGKVITIGASTNGPRYPLEGYQEEQFDLRLEKQPSGDFKCTSARYRYHNGQYYEGTCSVKFTKVAPDDAPGFDEGTFEVNFPKLSDFVNRSGKGHFRVKRDH
ncbi:MAG: CsgG/HfaB family protein [Myxococcaceae bacterium]